MEIPNPIDELPLNLAKALQENLQSGEVVKLVVPGSIGEALAVTDRRAIILREDDAGSEIRLFGHLVSQVKGARAALSGTGGCLELDLAAPPADAETARLHFPSYELARFEEAAEQVEALAAGEAPESGPQIRDGRCPKCRAEVEQGSVFCPACGNQLRTICQFCRSSSPVGSQYCGSCGQKMVEFVPVCRSCGGRVHQWMSFCPQCGAVRAAKCGACGTDLFEGAEYCVNCGRRPGAERVDAGAIRRVRERTEREATTPVGPPAPQEGAGASTDSTATMTAEQHNARGRELFESENYDEAVRHFEEAVRLDPDNASYHCNLAVAYDEAERDEEALGEYEKCLQLDPNDITALLSLGYLHSEQEEFDKSREVWSKILVIAPDSPEAAEARDNLRAQEQL